MTEISTYYEPVRPVEWQAKEAEARRVARHANILRWICGVSTEGEPILRTDLEQFGYTIVKKNPEEA